MNITESPWVIHDETHCPEEIYGAMEHLDGSARGQLVCTVNTWDVSSDTVLANARLIRGAPDMYAALIMILEMSDTASNSDDLEVLKQVNASIWRTAREVLAAKVAR